MKGLLRQITETAWIEASRAVRENGLNRRSAAPRRAWRCGMALQNSRHPLVTRKGSTSLWGSRSPLPEPPWCAGENYSVVSVAKRWRVDSWSKLRGFGVISEIAFAD